MSLFKRREKPTEQTEQSSLPDLPELAELPEFSDLNNFSDEKESYNKTGSNLPKLPSQTPSPIGPPTFPNKKPNYYNNLRLPFNVPLTKEISSGKEEVMSNSNEQASNFNRTGLGLRDGVANIREGGKPRTLELGEEEEITQDSIMQEIQEPISPNFSANRITKSSSGPVFVRIDKYQAAVQAFNEIKSQLEEIESSLREIKNLKQQEEQDLANWEAEIETIKTRLSNIDQGVFGKLG